MATPPGAAHPEQRRRGPVEEDRLHADPRHGGYEVLRLLDDRVRELAWVCPYPIESAL